MEIKASLSKPYTDTERADFIVQYNHNLGYEIKETEDNIEAWGYTEEEQAQKEKERIAMLHMTPLDFLKAIIKMGISYDTIKGIMEANPEVDMEMKYCQNVYRGHPMINQFATQFGVSQEQLDYIFKKANGEID